MFGKGKFCVPDLQKERKNCWFNQEEIINILDGGKKETDKRRALEEYFFADPEFLDQIPPDYLSHEELYANDLRKVCRLLHLANTDERLQKIATIQEAMRFADIVTADGNPLNLHFGMFLPAILGQGTSKQKEHWIPKVLAGKVIGTYAQTELGHGTFLRGLETTATYDQERQEFILNSPSVSSYKFWPGGLGKTATHAVVVAQLYTKGQCYGPHLFIVQLRDLDTHKCLKGIIVNEIGPRMGMNSTDNGCLALKKYSIPRENMLMRHSKVLKDGTFIKPINDKLSYGTMIFVRVLICSNMAKLLMRAVTIATRYSCVRRQSKILPNEPEPQVLDFQTQQFKILPNIASVFALKFVAQNVINIYTEVTQGIQHGKLDQLPDLHAIASGLKAQSSSDASYAIDRCRLACGGNGFIASSNLPKTFTFATPAMTYEGENTVLWLQTARYLVKCYNQRDVKPTSSLKYLAKNHFYTDGTSNNDILRKWEKSICSMLEQVTDRLRKLTNSGMRYELAWNKCTVDLVRTAEAHIRYFTCEQFIARLQTLEVSDSTRVILARLCRLYLLYHVHLNQGILMRSGSISAGELSVLENEMMELLAVLRNDAVSIVDSFDLHDRVLNSTLGSWDGNVYERIYEQMLLSPMNKTDVSEAVTKYLKPFMNSNL